MSLGRVDLRGETSRVTSLKMRADASRLAVVDSAGNPPEVTVKQVHALARDFDPGSAVDPRSPLSEVSHSVPASMVVDLGNEPTQRFKGEPILRLVVEAEVDVGLGVSRSAGVRAPEHNSLNPGA